LKRVYVVMLEKQFRRMSFYLNVYRVQILRAED
jgi:hypothetical protein